MTEEPLVFHPHNIPHAVAALRPDGQLPVVDQGYLDGGQCRIYKVDFPHRDESWAIRIPLHMQNLPRESIIAILQCETYILRQLEVKGFRWAPRLRGSSLTFENAVGYPFLALSWVEGESLVWSLEEPARDVRDKVLRQVAGIVMELLECTQEERDDSATQHVERIIDGKVGRIHGGTLPELTIDDCAAMKKLLGTVLRPELENAPFAIEHGNLSCGNIIVDSEYNITGLIDWGFAAKRPLQIACSLPPFLRPDPPILPVPLTVQEDRKVFLAALQSGPSTLAESVSLALSTENIDFEQCFLESITSKGTHRWLADQGWKIPMKGPEVVQSTPK